MCIAAGQPMQIRESTHIRLQGHGYLLSTGIGQALIT